MQKCNKHQKRLIEEQQQKTKKKKKKTEYIDTYIFNKARIIAKPVLEAA